MILAEFDEFKDKIRAVIIHKKKPKTRFCTAIFSNFFKGLKPLKGYYIVSPTIRHRSNPIIVRKIDSPIPILYIKFTLH